MNSVHEVTFHLKISNHVGRQIRDLNDYNVGEYALARIKEFFENEMLHRFRLSVSDESLLSQIDNSTLPSRFEEWDSNSNLETSEKILDFVSRNVFIVTNETLNQAGPEDYHSSDVFYFFAFALVDDFSSEDAEYLKSHNHQTLLDLQQKIIPIISQLAWTSLKKNVERDRELHRTNEYNALNTKKTHEKTPLLTSAKCYRCICTLI
jgi:hypothetical protein